MYYEQLLDQYYLWLEKESKYFYQENEEDEVLLEPIVYEKEIIEEGRKLI